MRAYLTDIEKSTLENEDFRRVLFTTSYSQLVLMKLEPNEDIGEEVHGLDQFIRIEQGTGETVIDGVSHPIKDGSAILIPAGTKHNIINTSKNPLKLYTIYSPPNHQDGIVFKTKANAEKSDEHFDGKTSL